MSFQIRVEPAAERNLSRMDPARQRQVVVLLRQLPGMVTGHQIGRPVKGARTLRLLEAGNCRIIFVVSNEEHAVHILAVTRIAATPDLHTN